MSESEFEKGMFVEVAVPLPVGHTYIYSVPEQFTHKVRTGLPVFVPFGKKNITGYIIDFCKDAPTGVKPILDIVSKEPLFSHKLLEVFRWISKYYLTPMGLVIKASIPPHLTLREKTMVHPKKGDLEKIKGDVNALSLYAELEKRPLAKKYIRRKFSDYKDAYNILLEKNLIYEKKVKVKPISKIDMNGVKLKRTFQKKILENLKKSAPKQAKIYELLSGKPEGMKKSAIYQELGNCYSSLNGLKKKELITYFESPFIQKIPSGSKKRKKKPVLTKEQKLAVQTIEKPLKKETYGTFLIFGITGSGKTEIYLRTVEKALNMDKSAIILIPEISLTAQTMESFKERFGDTVVVYHSRLAQKERVKIWEGIRNGKYRVIIGARFAIFAPVKNLGVIIVDEEHENTYKQKTKEPLYSARDAAVLRCKIEDAVCLLGSATPSLESFYNASKGKYHLITLPKRIDEKKLPPVEIIDMRKQKDFILSTQLLDKMKEKIEKGEQSILFINRRGFSNFLMCRDCGFSPQCPFCELTLTYHKKIKILKCHHCGYEIEAPSVCPKCNGSNFFYGGMGTQRIEEHLEKQLPELKLMRMDFDTMKRKWAHMEIFYRFRKGEADILLGTQMVTKGFDLPKVTLVGVVSADTVLNFPDFRAQERTFQLLTQVAGRTGRGILGGEVIIQTHAPQHYAIQASQKHNFKQFYTKEMKSRKELNYPPFSRLARIVLSSREKKKVESSSKKLFQKIKGYIKKNKYRIEILGPAPCPLSKLRGRYRDHILLKCKKPFLIQKILSPIRENFRISGVRIRYDIDPLDMM
jgi:primosomal protein N' (replication factor Y)